MLHVAVIILPRVVSPVELIYVNSDPFVWNECLAVEGTLYTSVPPFIPNPYQSVEVDNVPPGHNTILAPVYIIPNELLLNIILPVTFEKLEFALTMLEFMKLTKLLL